MNIRELRDRREQREREKRVLRRRLGMDKRGSEDRRKPLTEKKNIVMEEPLFRKSKVRWESYFDFSLLFLIFFISMVGLVVIYSASSYIAQAKNLPSTHFFRRQAISLVIGVGMMCVTSFIPYRFYLFGFPGFKRIRIAHLALLLAYFLQIFVLFFVKEGRNGSVRWIEIPGLGTVQPSEISKIAVILYTSLICYKNPKNAGGLFRVFISTWPVFPLLYLIGKENLSSAIIVAGIYVSIIFVTSKKYGYFLGLGALAVAAALLFEKFGSGYRNDRFKVWRNIEGEAKGFQILQGLYAIASGGLFGVGLGNSAGKFNKIPEAYNDMIFTIICEELGLFGGIAILALYVFVIMRLYIIAMHAPDLFGSLIAVGLMAQISIQVLLNVAVVTNLIPSTGVTLPFISYGGSSVIFLLAGVGIILNISKKIKYIA